MCGGVDALSDLMSATYLLWVLDGAEGWGFPSIYLLSTLLLTARVFMGWWLLGGVGWGDGSSPLPTYGVSLPTYLLPATCYLPACVCSVGRG